MLLQRCLDEEHGRGGVLMRSTRIQPAMSVGSYKTYEIRTPRATHWRKAACDEVDCVNYLNGWRVRIEGLSPELLDTAKNSGRRYSLLDVAEGETWLVFEPGQPCFQASTHIAPINRPELYIVRDGDWRGNPSGRTRTHVRGAEWVEDFAEHQVRLAKQINQG